jgi:hypothetical protein
LTDRAPLLQIRPPEKKSHLELDRPRWRRQRRTAVTRALEESWRMRPEVRETTPCPNGGKMGNPNFSVT